jgi:branched-chain amino acid transport system permease protein
MRSRQGRVWWVLVGIALVWPGVVAHTRYADYTEHLAVQMALLGLYAMSWDLLKGYVGLFSFGHAAFFGVGAYASAISIVHGGVTSALIVMLVAVACVSAVGLIVGILSSQVSTVSVFLVTFACAEVLHLVVQADPRGLTNGENGLPGVMPPPFLGLALSDRITFYYFSFAVVGLAYLALVRLTRSQFGQVLLAIRENETRATFAGYHVGQYKTAAFAVSAAFAGLAGVLTAFHERIAVPETFGWPLSGDAALYTILGGTGTLVGPLLGTIVVVLARELLSDLVGSWLIVVGALYITMTLFLPDGIYPLLPRSHRDE